MFASPARLIARTWPFWLIVWTLLAGGLWRVAPPWSRVVRDSVPSVPEDAPLARAQRLFTQAFPKARTRSYIVLVFHRTTGLTARDKLFVTFTLVPALGKLGSPESGTSPSDNSPSPIVIIRSIADQYVGQLLLSQDQQATIVQVELATDLFAGETRRLVEATDGLLGQLRDEKKFPEGLRVEVTGSAVIGHDLMHARDESGRALMRWTSWIVLLLLLAVDRRPLLVLVPLVALGLTILVTLRILTLLAQAGDVELYEGMEVYFILLVYATAIIASGLLAARQREALAAGNPSRQATAAALAGSGKAILVGGVSAVAGGAVLLLVKFPRYHLAGTGVVAGLLVTLGLALTFIPSLLRLMGRWAFWPAMPGRPVPARPRWLERLELAGRLRRIWTGIARLVRRRPGTVSLAVAVLTLPLAAVGIWRYNGLSFALVRELPPEASSRQGIRLLKEHFPPGIIAPVTLLIVDKGVDFGSSEGIHLVRTLSQRLLALQDGVPLADIRSVADPIGVTEVARHAIPGPPEVVALIEQIIHAESVVYYVGETHGATRNVTRLDLIFNRDPMSDEMIESLDRVEEVVRRELPDRLRGAQLHLLGITPELHDLGDAVLRDRSRIEGWATLSVLAVLIIALRRITIPVLIVLGIWLSYLASMGATHLLFRQLAASAFSGISWQVAILLYLTLIVTGCHHSLLLLTQAEQLQHRHGFVRGITQAIRRSGGIVAGSTIVLAGTFASMAAGAALAGVYQFAFAMALAILLDGLFVRLLLIPSLMESGRSLSQRHIRQRLPRSAQASRQES